MSSSKNLLLRLGEKCPEYAGNADFKDQIEACFSVVRREIEHSGDDVFPWYQSIHHPLTMDIERFFSPCRYYNDPRAASAFGAANTWQNYGGNATYQANNPYGYVNSGYGACYTRYHQQFNQRYPLYSSNFSPHHHPWQAASSQSTPYLYQPSGFASSDFQSAGMVPEGASAMNFYYDNNPTSCSGTSMVGNSHITEHFHTALPFQQQYPPSSTAITDSYPIGYPFDELIPMVINNSTSLHTDEILNNVFITNNLIESAISEASSEGEGLAEYEISKEERHSSLKHKMFDEMPIREVAGPLHSKVEKHSCLEHKMFDEMLIREVAGPFSTLTPEVKSLERQPELKESTFESMNSGSSSTFDCGHQSNTNNEILRYDNDLDLHVGSIHSGSTITFDCDHQSTTNKEIDGYYLRRLIVDELAKNGDDKEESKMFMVSSPLAMYTKIDILEDEHKVFDEMLTSEAVGYLDKLDVVCGNFVETKKQWGDNTCSVVEKVKDVVNCIETGYYVTSSIGEAQAQRYSGGGAHLVINSSGKNHYKIGQLEKMRMEDTRLESKSFGILEVSQEEDSSEEVKPLKRQKCPTLKMLLEPVMNSPSTDGFDLESQKVENTYNFNIDVNKSEHSPLSIIIWQAQNYLATNGVTDSASNAITKSSKVHSLVKLVREEWPLLHRSLIAFALGDMLGREVDSSFLSLLGHVDFVDWLNDLRELRPLDFTFFSCIRLVSQENAQSMEISLRDDSSVVNAAITMCSSCMILNVTYLVFEKLKEKVMQLVLIVSGNSATSASRDATSGCDRGDVEIVMIRILLPVVDYAAKSNVVVIAEIELLHYVSDSMREHLPLMQEFPGGGTYQTLVTYSISVSLYLVFEYMKHDLGGAPGINKESSFLSKTMMLHNTNYSLSITRTSLQNFLLLEIFSSVGTFDEWFQISGEIDQRKVVWQLRMILHSFLLRRFKSDVEKGLPPKMETIIKIGMCQMQKHYCRSLLQKYLEVNFRGEQTCLLNITMLLQKCCNSPRNSPYTTGVYLLGIAGKMVLLNKLFPKLEKYGLRGFIFYMARLLDILTNYLMYIGHKCCRIDGDTGEHTPMLTVIQDEGVHAYHSVQKVIGVDSLVATMISHTMILVMKMMVLLVSKYSHEILPPSFHLKVVDIQDYFEVFSGEKLHKVYEVLPIQLSSRPLDSSFVNELLMQKQNHTMPTEKKMNIDSRTGTFIYDNSTQFSFDPGGIQHP